MASPGSAGSPRYVAIAADLRQRILSQQLGPHTLLPSERELSEQHGVSRMTARQALTLLESEGHVYRRPPRGTFVAEPRIRFRIGSFSREVSRMGHRASAELLWARQLTADEPTRAALGLAEGGQVNGFQRLRLMEGEPITLETTYFPADLTDGILDKPVGGSLWRLLKDSFDIDVASSDVVIESIILDEHACELLRVRAASPGILLTRLTFDTLGRRVEYARDVYRADRAAFEVSAAVAV
jgi:GntR family transcriptional regulator